MLGRGAEVSTLLAGRLIKAQRIGGSKSQPCNRIAETGLEIGIAVCFHLVVAPGNGQRAGTFRRVEVSRSAGRCRRGRGRAGSGDKNEVTSADPAGRINEGKSILGRGPRVAEKVEIR